MASRVDFKLILITDTNLKIDLCESAANACSNGVKAVQVREKKISAMQLLNLSKKLRTITGKYHSKLIINDRFDIAVLCNANGLHSPERGISPVEIKNNRGFIFGRSVHSVISAKKAELLKFDYLIFGPVYRTPAKTKFGKPQGLETLKEVCNCVTIPVFAVGGINPVRARKCIEAGAHGVAVIREILLSEDIGKTVNDFKNELGIL